MNTIYHTISRKKVGVSKCITCGESITAPPDAPGYCKSHRNNVSPVYGWMYVSREQCEILRIIEEAGLTETLYEQLMMKDATKTSVVIQEAMAIMSFVESDSPKSVDHLDYIETEL